MDFIKSLKIPMVMPKRVVMQRLALAWSIGSALLFTLVFLQTMAGAYADRAEEAWNWLLPTVMPTMLLIVGALVADSRGNQQEKDFVGVFIYRLALALSVFYLVIVITHVVIPPIFKLPTLKTMSSSHIYLGPLQGLVGLAVGAFFVEKKNEEK